MDLLIVGDVHGCYHTFKKLLKDHWDPRENLLVQVGDLVNKGPHSVKCIEFWMHLQKTYPGKVVMLRGNHEQKLIEAIRRPYVLNTCSRVRAAVKKSDVSLKAVLKFLENLPLKWENEHILITHAGIGKNAKEAYSFTSRKGVLFNKGPLQSLEQVQVKGHSIVDGNKPVFNAAENAWYIDTGAWTKKYLSAVRMDSRGAKKEVVRVRTHPKDRKVKFSLF